ncbi:hypothetical protein FRC10_011208 [Ceratobasidium sp. 414]|nr:hypothetical protein FRC10_011208 [Ceratobasidium sp. 414]
MSDSYTKKATNQNLTPQQKIDGLKEILATTKTGMLTTRGTNGELHSRAMAPASSEGVPYTYGALNYKTDEMEANSQVNVSFFDLGSSNWVSIAGTASLSQDKEKIKKLWSPLTKAWFGNLGDGIHKGDENDPRVVIIDVAPSEIRYWRSTRTKVGAAIEVVTSAVTGDVASPGELRTITKQELALVEGLNVAAGLKTNGFMTRRWALTRSRAKRSRTRASTSNASMSYSSQRPETPPSVILPSAGLAGPSIFDLSSLPSDTPNKGGTGHGGTDLSLSDLSMTDSRVNLAKATGGAATKWDEEEEYEPDPPFRLFNESPAPKRVIPEPEEEPTQDEEEEEDLDRTIAQSERGAGDDDLDETELSIHTPQRSTRPADSPPPSVHSRSRTAAERREEQLHAALFQLRKMNAVFGDYVGALDAVQGNTEAKRQVERTNAILDRYVKMLGQQEQIAKLVLDEEWGGGESDEQTIQQRIEQKAREERERKEREERERREREERERQEAERALIEQEARERAEKAAAGARGRSSRGVATRGTGKDTCLLRRILGLKA